MVFTKDFTLQNQITLLNMVKRTSRAVSLQEDAGGDHLLQRMERQYTSFDWSWSYEGPYLQGQTGLVGIWIRSKRRDELDWPYEDERLRSEGLPPTSRSGVSAAATGNHPTWCLRL